MSYRPGPVSTFKRHREAFISNLNAQAEALRNDPRCAEDVAANLRELVHDVYSIRSASMVMAAEARGNAFVQAKPYGFYGHNVPRMCNDLVACLLHWADILVNTDGRRTDGIVAGAIEGVVASLGL
ncbi:uncharacterized protein N7515_001482 [Penicillium bovifimosum]|uniref:Uncharacterized protein n=1 Tax=Penicillium bovifimosum TaxID=126998 RepID=A0A9W9L760_9EURO|nr:uncharacterized protein N7515_001482 [Penicillium bovifimosum]KAJ5142695.1 hypothetical protein N7515_001482 [Penicillium bovifimosum]